LESPFRRGDSTVGAGELPIVRPWHRIEAALQRDDFGVDRLAYVDRNLLRRESHDLSSNVRRNE
jgi:hypothetical protein